MQLHINKTEPILMESINDFESSNGLMLPKSYKDFLLEYNGSKPDDNIFYFGSEMCASVERFIPISDLINKKLMLDFYKKEFIPIACLEGGDFVFLDMINASIYFYSHELEYELILISKTFKNFMEILCPFDKSSVELDESEIEYVWIDEEFFNNIKKN